jgi:hypothetical protein
VRNLTSADRFFSSPLQSFFDKSWRAGEIEPLG